MTAYASERGVSVSSRRQGDLDDLRNAATAFFGDEGRWAYEAWELLNREAFADTLEPVGIVFGLTPHGHTLGYYSPGLSTITLHPSLLRRLSMAWGLQHKGYGLAFDVLAHEMIHQWQDQVGRRGKDSHRIQSWADGCNMISESIGLGGFYMPLYKRTKERGTRRNVWVLADADEERRAKGRTLVPPDQVAQFPGVLRKPEAHETTAETRDPAECLAQLRETSGNENSKSDPHAV